MAALGWRLYVLMLCYAELQSCSFAMEEYVAQKNVAAVVVSIDADIDCASTIAKRLGVELLGEQDAQWKLESDALVLALTSEGLALKRSSLMLQADLEPMIKRIQASKLKSELLVRAARIKATNDVPARTSRALDATAGLGEDSLLLAAAGFSVDLYERDPVIYLLLEDALRRAALNPVLSSIAARMCLHEHNSIVAMQQLAQKHEAFDVVLLDPMFPERKKAASVKKKLQLIQSLEAPAQDEEELLSAAILLGPRKVIIKRPVKGPYLAGVKPAYSIAGKAVRFDCLVPASLSKDVLLNALASLQ